MELWATYHWSHEGESATWNERCFGQADHLLMLRSHAVTANLREGGYMIMLPGTGVYVSVGGGNLISTKQG